MSNQNVAEDLNYLLSLSTSLEFWLVSKIWSKTVPSSVIKSQRRIEANWNPNTKTILRHDANARFAARVRLNRFDHF